MDNTHNVDINAESSLFGLRTNKEKKLRNGRTDKQTDISKPSNFLASEVSSWFLEISTGNFIQD